MKIENRTNEKFIIFFSTKTMILFLSATTFIALSDIENLNTQTQPESLLPTISITSDETSTYKAKEFEKDLDEISKRPKNKLLPMDNVNYYSEFVIKEINRVKVSNALMCPFLHILEHVLFTAGNHFYFKITERQEFIVAKLYSSENDFKDVKKFKIKMEEKIGNILEMRLQNQMNEAELIRARIGMFAIFDRNCANEIIEFLTSEKLGKLPNEDILGFKYVTNIIEIFIRLFNETKRGGTVVTFKTEKFDDKIKFCYKEYYFVE